MPWSTPAAPPPAPSGSPTAEPMPWSTPEVTPTSGRGRGGTVALLVAGLAGVLVVGGAITAVTIADRGHRPTGAAAPSPSAVYVSPVDGPGSATATLQAMTAALLRNDEAGWLAGIDPGDAQTREFFQHRFRALHALGVSQFSLNGRIPPSVAQAVSTFEASVNSAYCFSLDTCPKYQFGDLRGSPNIGEEFTFRLVGGRWLVNKARSADVPDHLQPAPWEDGDLVFAVGPRVTVAATPDMAKRLPEVFAAANQSVPVVDRFAAMAGNPQRRYRIYLADADGWKRWYGQDGGDDGTLGYTIGLNEIESDVVLHMDPLTSKAQLRNTLQHEMGHVATVGGIDQGADAIYDFHMWLKEGIAEYIGGWPRPATTTPRMSSVRRLESSKRHPTTIDLEPLPKNSSGQAFDEFYGASHLAMACMATKYSEPKMIQFVKLVLRDNKTYDQASRAAFGTSFTSVDTGCVTWIRQRT
jgi:hypothetical protein